MYSLAQIKQLYANIGKLITSSLELDKVLEGIMEEVKVFFDAENWSLMRLDPNTDELFFVIVQGIDRKAVENIRLGPGEGIAGMVAKTGKSVFVPDTSADPRFSDRVDRASGFRTRSVMAVPLIFRGAVYGVIELVNRTTGASYTEDEHLVLQTIADFSAIAFANAALYEKVLSLGATDPLTGLGNRANLEEIILNAEQSAGRRRRRVDEDMHALVAVIDIDDFKGINDTYGHREGDAVLKEISRLLRAHVRGNDTVFRIGGDEFLVLMTGPSAVTLAAMENRMRASLSSISEFSMGTRYSVHLSYGTCSGPLSSMRDLIHRADLEMYQNKKAPKDGTAGG